MNEVRTITSIIEPIENPQDNNINPVDSSGKPFLETVKDLIKQKGYKDKYLANMCQISPAFFSQIKSGKKPMPSHVREKLTSFLGL
jgi:hypothetical protein